MKSLLIGIIALGSFSAFSSEYCSIKYQKASYDLGFKTFQVAEKEIALKNNNFNNIVSIVKDKDGDVLGVFVPEIDEQYVDSIKFEKANMDEKNNFLNTLKVTYVEENLIVKLWFKSLENNETLAVKANNTELELNLIEGQNFKLSIPLVKSVRLVCEKD